MPSKTPKWFAEHRRVLWFWCDGHQRYEIAAVERMIGSEAFEQRLLDHWGSDVLYRITTEAYAGTILDGNWTHPGRTPCGCPACKIARQHNATP